MSLFSALTTSVAGVQAQSFAMENISDNIANSRTSGYKRVDTSFSDMVPSAPRSMQQGGSVRYQSSSTNSIAGGMNATGVGTNVALFGSGFMMVREKVQGTTGQTNFSATDMFTRRGDFVLDRDGYLVNGGGNYLVGRQLDPTTGAVVGAAPDVIQITGGFSPPNATKSLTYIGNLPSVPQTANYSASVAGSDVWAAGNGTPGLLTPTSAPSSSSFASNSISGQSTRMYDAVGRPQDINLRWAKVGAGATPGSTKWALYYDSTPAGSTAASEWSLATTAEFDSSGKITTPTAAVSVNMASRGLGTISVDVSGRNMTQYADVTGVAKISSLTQDGYSAGSFMGVEIGQDGRVNGYYTNGQIRPLAMMSIAQFTAPELLKRNSGSAFEQTAESGIPTFDAGTTSVQSGALEGSNTDISEEFSKMIVTQQAYSANTRVMSSTQDMLKEIMNVIR
jgi:flagellar hook protein FlgE